MKYELIGKNDYLFNAIDTILGNRGIDDVQSFLHTSEKDVVPWSKLRNIEKAVDCLLKHIEKESKIFVQIDSDIDGISSSAILINYLHRLYPSLDIQWRLQKGKQHGVKVDTVPDDVNLVIIPDAGSNQLKEHAELKAKGMDIIVLDHHETDRESENAIVVSNQLSPEYLNKTLTGAGIVYKFIQAFDNKLGINIADNYLDLVAVGLIGDMADSRNLESRYYMLKGLKNIKNSFLSALYEKQSFSTKGVTNIVNTQFYIVPLVNAAIRNGSQEEKEQMFKAFLESDEKIYYKKKDEWEPIQVASARMLVNLRAKQNRQRDKGVAAIEERVVERNLLQNKVLIVNITELLDKNHTGLVANQLARLYKRPVLLIRQKGDSTVFGGSARGYEKGAIKDLKQFLTDTGKFVFCEGHANAHGIEIEAENLVEVNELINEQLKDIEIDMDIHEVDFIIPGTQFTEGLVKDIHSLRDLWGYKVEEPLIAIKDVSVNKDQIFFNEKKSGKKKGFGEDNPADIKGTIVIKYRDISFVKYFANKEMYNSIIDKGENVILSIVGKAGLNEWEGRKSAQVVMEEFEVTGTKKKEFIF